VTGNGEAVERTGGILPISIRKSIGHGRTAMSSFDDALHRSGVSNYNLIRLSSVIPAQSVITPGESRVQGEHGDRLYCVYAAAFADRPGTSAWAGIGWVRDAEGRGLFIEHDAESEKQLDELIQLSLEDMDERRGGGYGAIEKVTVGADYDGRPTCALVIATYEVQGWTLS
jgi:arginine decarboxylase